jgi:hypothetical protein
MMTLVPQRSRFRPMGKQDKLTAVGRSGASLRSVDDEARTPVLRETYQRLGGRMKFSRHKNLNDAVEVSNGDLRMRVLEETASGINFWFFLEQTSDGIKRLDHRWKITAWRRLLIVQDFMQMRNDGTIQKTKLFIVP